MHEFTAPHMLSSSDAESVAIADVLALEPDAAERLFAQRLGYTESAGAPELRAAAAALYETTSPEDVIVVAAAEEGIFAAYHALLQPGDHVVVETPCYESAVQVARSTGAAVSEWRRSAADDWAHDLDALEAALQPNTRLVYVNSPHNPTGLLMPREVLDRVVELCAERGAWLFADEVYRELEHDVADRLPAAVDLYDRAISLGSMSKTYGLPGLRLGWLASRDSDALARIVSLKHYTTICSSAPSELLSALALRHRDVFADRSRAIVLLEPRARGRLPRAAREPPLVGAPEREHDRVRPGRRCRGHGAVLRAARRGCRRPAPARHRVRRPDARPPRVRALVPSRGARAIRGVDHRNTFLTRLDRDAQTMRKVSEQPADTP